MYTRTCNTTHVLLFHSFSPAASPRKYVECMCVSLMLMLMFISFVVVVVVAAAAGVNSR